MARLGSDKPGHKYLSKKRTKTGKVHYVYHDAKPRSKKPEEQKTERKPAAPEQPQQPQIPVAVNRPASSYMSGIGNPQFTKPEVLAWFRGSTMPSGVHAALFGSGFVKKITDEKNYDTLKRDKHGQTIYSSTYIPKTGTIAIGEKTDHQEEDCRFVTGLALDRFVRTVEPLKKYSSDSALWKDCVVKLRDRYGLRDTVTPEYLFAESFAQHAGHYDMLSVTRPNEADDFMAHLLADLDRVYPDYKGAAGHQDLADVKEYKPFASVEECAKFAEETLGVNTVDYEGLPVDTANAITKGLFDDISVGGKVKIDSIKAEPHELFRTAAVMETIHMGGAAAVQLEVYRDVLQAWQPHTQPAKREAWALRGEMSMRSEKLIRRLNQMNPDDPVGFNVGDYANDKAGGIRAMAIHEMGHARMDLLPAPQKDEFKNAIAGIYNRIAAAPGKVGNESPSEYAMTSADEFAAESYASWRTGLNSAGVPADMLALLQKTFKKQEA